MRSIGRAGSGTHKALSRDHDNKPQNGLLLRADIHTLFDLNLIGIEPDQLQVTLHPAVKAVEMYSSLDGKNLRCDSKRRPSREALSIRFKQFQQQLLG